MDATKSPRKGGTRVAVVRAAREGRGVTTGVVLTAVVLIALVVAVAIFVGATKRSHDHAEEERAAAEAPPSVFTDRGTLRFGDPAAATVLTVSTDFACPSCRTFAQTSDTALADLTRTGKVAVEYDLVAIVGGADHYSARAANASACVAASDKDAWPAWYRSMFDQQPAKDSPGMSDDHMVDLATRAGASAPEVATCIHANRYQQFVTAHTDKVVAAGLNHTPTVRIGDRVVENLTPDGLRAAVDRAAAK
ncbi:DsbA family protein [Nocardia transvalensis]|uniref:DsbA family protein n=1 Tax=Nocardia transvalensis TaxID=37333 RepID=UPI001893DB4C|nr:thioredoxin domain-containing protein [Nocardia transvalensis]MBF6330898.1 thioredoxin domain-containing protein [Nocardia transvalensis]